MWLPFDEWWEAVYVTASDAVLQEFIAIGSPYRDVPPHSVRLGHRLLADFYRTHFFDAIDAGQQGQSIAGLLLELSDSEGWKWPNGTPQQAHEDGIEPTDFVADLLTAAQHQAMLNRIYSEPVGGREN